MQRGSVMDMAIYTGRSSDAGLGSRSREPSGCRLREAHDLEDSSAADFLGRRAPLLERCRVRSLPKHGAARCRSPITWARVRRPYI